VFEGNNFFLRSAGGGENGLEGSIWGASLLCASGVGGIGTDCNGLPLNAIKYDTPTFGGFSFSASWGEDDFWDVAARYANTWGNFKVSAAVGYNEINDERYVAGAGGAAGFRAESNFFQAGASIMHTPTGLFVYGLYSNDENEGTGIPGVGPLPVGPITGRTQAPDMETFYIKAGIKRTWNAYGATTLFGEYGDYEDGFRFTGNVCGASLVTSLQTGAAPGLGGVAGTNLNAACNAGPVEVVGSEVQRYGLGINQEIDAAAMQLWANWQRYEIDLDFVTTGGARVNQGFEDLDIFMVGGVIFF
jgi:predicted porin